MYLKSIELQGFKSFPDKTLLNFESGITVVIGPNGSGKSNIADAMRWVLGEVSSRNIRGTKMEDVIFGGCDDRKPMNYAQVSITLDNSSPIGRLNIEYDEVTVTRRYFRSGDSDYLINGKAVRLKDIHQLFMNTGIGRGGYSVIGQGKIAEIVSQKSEERRNVFEEAAGISRYKYSKDEALKKLAVTEDNLSRVTDILSELESRVGPLEKEAEKAKKYLELYTEKKQTDISLWLYDITALAEETAKLKASYELHRHALELAEEELSALERKSEALFEASGDNKYNTERLQAEIARLSEEKYSEDGKIRLALNEIEHIKVRAAELTASASLLRTEKNQLSEALSDKQRQIAELKTRCTEAEETLAAREKAHGELTQRLEEESTHADDLSDEIRRLEAELIDLKIRLTVTDTAAAQNAEIDAKLDSDIRAHRENIDALSARAEKGKASMDKYMAGANEEEEKAAKQAEELADAQKRLAALEAESNEIFLSLASKKHRIENLRRMEEAFEGYYGSVRFVMSEYEKGNIRGKNGGSCGEIYGPLSRLIRVPAAYTVAIETALGTAMQNIVVENDETAKAAIAHLKRANSGRATFYPVATMKPSYLSQNEKEFDAFSGYVGMAHTLLSYDDKFDAVVRNLLGRTVVFDNLDNATTFARRYDYKIRIVTLDGQQINAGGSFTGGSVKHDSGMLSRGREIENLKKEITDLSAQSDRKKAETETLRATAEKLRGAMADTENRKNVLLSLYNAENTQYQVLRSQIDEDEKRLSALSGEKNDALRREEEKRKERAEDEAKRDALTETIAKAKERLAAAEESIRGGNAEQEQLRRGMSEAQIALIALQKDLTVCEESAAELTMRLSAAEENLRKTEEAQTAQSEMLSRHTETAARGGDVLDALSSQIDAARTQLETLSKENIELEKQLTEVRTAEKEKQHKKEMVFREFTQSESRLEGKTAERDKLIATLYENYELTYSDAKELDYPRLTAEERGSAVKRQTELKNKLRALGNVNVGAVEEYAEVKERYDFLHGQTEDLSRSKTDLEEIIYKLEEEMRTGFLSAFDEINHHFKDVFVRLFGGGTAELVLKDPENVLESGIDINVAPPGKIIKNLSLLSGGEQSFVAIALYFALIEVNPTPFIMLDEIEAALDEVNVDRFAEYLRQNVERTQFILISHRRGTMEAADRLYGVTMPTKGISRVLSVNVSEIEAKIGKLD